jgi:Tfp pilus assembly protein PilN
MPTRDIIGVDFPPGRIVIAVVGESTTGSVVRYAVSREMPAGADATTAAALLRQMLEETGAAPRQAVLAIPAGRGFVQPMVAEANPPDIEYSSASWTTRNGKTLQAVATRADVSWLREVAAQAGVTARVVTLRSLACLRALGLSEPSADGVSAGVVLGRNVASLLVACDGEVLAAHSREIPEPSGPNRQRVASTVIEQMVRLAVTTLGQPGPKTLWLILDTADAEVTSILSGTLGIPIETRLPAQSNGLDLGPAREEAGQFAPAIGLALQGLTEAHAGEAARRANANLLRTDRSSSRDVRWRLSGAIAASLVAILLIAWGATAFARYQVLRGLREAQRNLLDQRLRNEITLEQWRAIRGWVASSAGRRREVRAVCNCLQQLMPDDAYVTSLSLLRQTEGPPVVRLEGRAASGQSLYDFVSRLEDSTMFSQASLGAVTELPTEDEYERRFNMTVELQE